VCEHIGLGSDIAPQLFSADGRFLSTLILSPPGGGKTTLLRDLIRVLSLGDAEHRALRVAVIDERCELAVCCKGRAQMELGNHTDVLSLCPKAVGIPMVLRGMNPQVIAVDEITAEEDIRAMCLAANCGVGLLTSIHAASVDELHQKPLWRELLRARVFRRCIVIRSNGGARSYEVGDLPCSD
jgi:stage III sporulation protein AA